jgi:hypothetical protein
MGGFMHLPRSLAALSAALLLAATMPQLGQAREVVGFSDSYSSGTVRRPWDHTGELPIRNYPHPQHNDAMFQSRGS